MIRARILAFAFLPMVLADAAAYDEELPVGSAPRPVACEHFPDRLHAVIWRNWQLVRPSILARVLGTSEDRIESLAASMGLPPAGNVPPGLAHRAYITVLRRNWHLLPYEQLLPLVGMSRAELAYSLREDDFLFIKLGNLKPQCSPVRYTEPDPAARARADEIKAVVETRFGDAIRRGGEPRYAFVDRIARFPRDTGRPRDRIQTVRVTFTPTSAATATHWPTAPPIRILTACSRGSRNAVSTACGCTSCSGSSLREAWFFPSSARAASAGLPIFASW